MTVEKQLAEDGSGKVEESEPKTDSSISVVPLDRETVRVLRRHHTQQKADRLKWGDAWVDTGRVFTQENGEWLNPGWLSEHFARIATKSGLPPIRLHDLRHGTASLLKAPGAATEVISETLRHSSKRITEETYISVSPRSPGTPPRRPPRWSRGPARRPPGTPRAHLRLRAFPPTFQARSLK